MGCIQLCPEKDLKHWGNQTSSPSCSFMSSASNCSWALGHSITKYCFSTRYTKSFLSTAGEARWGFNNRGTVSTEWFTAQSCLKWKWPKAPFHFWAFTCDYFLIWGKAGCNLGVASKKAELYPKTRHQNVFEGPHRNRRAKASKHKRSSKKG